MGPSSWYGPRLWGQDGGAGPGIFFGREWRSSWNESGRPGLVSPRERGDPRNISSQAQSHLAAFGGNHTVEKQAKAGKERNAETAIEQRVLPAQRGPLQRGGPHPLRSLLHLRPSTSCSGPPTNLHQGQQRLQ